MSTDYGLCCLDCKDKAFHGGLYDIRWDEILRMYKNRVTLAKIYDLVKELEGMPVEIEIHINYSSISYDFWEFLKVHYSHNMGIVDEYGWIWNENREKLGEFE